MVLVIDNPVTMQGAIAKVTQDLRAIVENTASPVSVGDLRLGLITFGDEGTSGVCASFVDWNERIMNESRETADQKGIAL